MFIRSASEESPRIAPCAPFASSAPGIRAQLRRFAGKHALFLAIAAFIYGSLWAIQPEATRLSVVLVYTLCLCNFTAFGLKGLNFLYAERSPLTFWLGFTSVLILLTSVTVPATAAIVFYGMKRPGGPFLNYLGANWKFAAVATIAFGVAAQICEVMKFKLEQRNQELRDRVEQDREEREAREEQLERGRENATGSDSQGNSADRGVRNRRKVGTGGNGRRRLMAKVQAMVRAFAPESASTARLCERVNGELCDNEAADKMGTLFYGVLDAERKTLRYTSAGHPRPILKRADGTVEQLEDSGAVLGVFPSWKYEESIVQLAPGDLLLLFTDGITEAANPGGEEFGEKRLIQVVEALAGKPPSELNEKFFGVVKDWCGSHLADDATLIAIAAGAAKGREVQPEERPALAA